MKPLFEEWNRQRTDDEDQDADRQLPPPDNISRAACEAARAEFDRRELVGGDLDGLPEVIVAVGVTADDVDRVPYSWIEGLKLELRADGKLIAVCASVQHAAAVAEVTKQVEAYAYLRRATAGLRCLKNVSLPLQGGRVANPDVVLFCPVQVGNQSVAIVAFVVAVAGHSWPATIVKAGTLLASLPLVHQVACLKLYDARDVGDHLLAVPALAVAFGRGAQANAGIPGANAPIRIEQMRSFGNVNVTQHGLQSFMVGPNAHPMIENPFQPIELQPLMRTVAFLDGPFVVAELNGSWTRLLKAAQRHVNRTGQAFVVGMPEGLPPIRVDLPRVFVAAMRAFCRDRNAGQQQGVVIVPNGLAIGRHWVWLLWESVWGMGVSFMRRVFGLLVWWTERLSCGLERLQLPFSR